MENWIFLFLGLILGIPFSIFANFATPWLKSYFRKRSLSTRERKLDILTEHYKDIKRMKENPTYLNSVGFYNLSFGLLTIFVQVTAVGVTLLINLRSSAEWVMVFNLIVNLLLVILLILGGLLLFRPSIQESIDLMSFEEYKQKTIEEIIKLGGNPEDLDKEETS